MCLQSKEIPIDKLWVVLPVKSLELSKQRLKDCLGPLRPGLTEVMLADVLDALRSSATVSGVVVVTMDAEVAALAATKGATLEEEAGPFGMNRAIGQGFAAARRLGAAWLAVLPLDIPLLTGAEFDRLVRELDSRATGADEPALGIVPSSDGQGTNWLCTRADVAFKPAYGPGSYRRHLEAARAQGQRPITLASPSVSLDIDEAADLETFSEFCRLHDEFRCTRTWQFLHALNARPAEYAGRHPNPTDESSYVISKS
jgi:2-phospho-L-lactate guanylyltransferase